MSTLRKILTTGVGAALMTEEGIRTLLSDMQLPKQAKNYVTRQAIKGKDEFMKLVLSEFKKFLQHINWQEELKKALNGLGVEINTKIRFSSSDRKIKVKVSKVRR